MLYHGVEPKGLVGIYRTYWALLDRDDPSRMLHLADDAPLIAPNPELIAPIRHLAYLEDIVFTTGIVDDGDHYIVASGEADLACRITHVPKALFTRSEEHTAELQSLIRLSYAVFCLKKKNISP